VVLASDRRFTWVPPVKDPDDNANKSILLCGHFHLGYTGLGELQRKRTDIWVADILHGKQPSEYFTTIRDRASRLFQTLNIAPSLKAHTFLGVGFSSLPDDPTVLHPLVVAISNCMNEHGLTVDRTEPQFTMRAWRIPPGRPQFLCWAGRPLYRDEFFRLRRILDRYVTRGGGSTGVARLLGSQIRLVADRDPKVGQGLMISALPRSAVGRTGYAMNLQGPSFVTDSPSAIYVPKESTKPEWYGPTTVCPDQSSHDVKISTDRPPWA
jgi:hypothetical protein